MGDGLIGSLDCQGQGLLKRRGEVGSKGKGREGRKMRMAVWRRAKGGESDAMAKTSGMEGRRCEMDELRSDAVFGPPNADGG